MGETTLEQLPRVKWVPQNDLETNVFYKAVGTGLGFDETIFGFMKPTKSKPEPVSLKQIRLKCR